MFKVLRLGVIALFGVMLIACAAGVSQSPIGYLDSNLVSSRIKTKLDNELGPNAIIVRTYRDEVQLTGHVPNLAVKEKAGEIAANVGDIKYIRNDLMIGRRHV